MEPCAANHHAAQLDVFALRQREARPRQQVVAVRVAGGGELQPVGAHRLRQPEVGVGEVTGGRQAERPLAAVVVPSQSAEDINQLRGMMCAECLAPRGRWDVREVIEPDG